MPLGPGKYDDLCTKVREEASAEGVVIIIRNGNKGSGFSVQFSNPIALVKLPGMLEIMAKEIRESLANG